MYEKPAWKIITFCQFIIIIYVDTFSSTIYFLALAQVLAGQCKREVVYSLVPWNG